MKCTLEKLEVNASSSKELAKVQKEKSIASDQAKSTNARFIAAEKVY